MSLRVQIFGRVGALGLFPFIKIKTVYRAIQRHATVSIFGQIKRSLTKYNKLHYVTIFLAYLEEKGIECFENFEIDTVYGFLNKIAHSALA